jgi:hypothetical protein
MTEASDSIADEHADGGMQSYHSVRHSEGLAKREVADAISSFVSPDSCSTVAASKALKFTRRVNSKFQCGLTLLPSNEMS